MTRLVVGLGVAIAVVAGVARAAPDPTTSAAGACAVPTTFLGPPSTRPHYALRVHVARSRTAADGTLAPAGLQVLASGAPVGPGRWRAVAVRDVALAVGAFRQLSMTVSAPRPVRVLVGLERGSPYKARDFLLAAANALRFYSGHYGEYPWTTYSLAVMRDFNGLAGTAYPTLGFLGDGSLVLVPHETAHQWFYSLVGNDQSRDPWLSEGLATWAQTGPEQSLQQMLATPMPAPVKDRIGEPMSFWQAYDFEMVREGLYVQSVQALAELGDATTVDCALRRFVVQNAYRTADPRDLLAALVPDFPNAERQLRARGARF